MEYVDLKGKCKNGRHQTSFGRELVVYACRPPCKGETYLRNTQQRGIWEVRVADNDHKNHNYPICKIRY